MDNNFGKSIKNISVSLVCQMVTLFISFLTRSVFIRFLSAEYLGVNGLFSNILTLLSFSELGIGNVMIYSLYAPLKNKDYERTGALLTFFKKAYMVIAITVFVVGCAITPILQYLIKDPPNLPESIYVLFLLYLANTSVSYICTYKKSLLLADRRNYVVNLTTSMTHVFMLATQITVLIISKSFIAYLVCQIVWTLCTNVVLSIIANKNYPHIIKTKHSELPKEELRKIGKDIKALAISKVSGTVSSGTDNIIISKMFGLTPVGLVSNYLMIINSVNGIFYHALSSISSSIGNFNVGSDTERKRKVFDELFFVVYLIYSFVCTCLLILSEPFIEMWIGTEYTIPFFVLLNLVIGIYVGGLNYPVYVFRTTSGYFKEVQHVYVLCAVSNIVLSIVLGKVMGIAGVFMATWVSKLLLTEVADSFYSYKKILERRHIMYFVKYFLFALLATLNACICWFVVDLIPMQGWESFFIKAIVCGSINVIINTLALFYRWEFKSIINRIMLMIRREK